MGALPSTRDVTQMRLQDEALRKSEKLAAVGQLASSIAHEINNPLESITNLLYLIRRADAMSEVQEYAEMAQGRAGPGDGNYAANAAVSPTQSRRASEVDLADLTRTVMALYTGRLLVRGVAAGMEECCQRRRSGAWRERSVRC